MTTWYSLNFLYYVEYFVMSDSMQLHVKLYFFIAAQSVQGTWPILISFAGQLG